MIHDIETIAQNRFLESAIVRKVGETFDPAIRIGGSLFIGTWHCDDFIERVRRAQGSDADNERIRSEQIAKRFGAKR